MELNVSLFIANWKDEDFRDAEEGFRCLEDIVMFSSADIFVFPGGFITEDSYIQRERYRKRIRDIGFNGLLVTGFDKNEQAMPLVTGYKGSFVFEQSCSYAEDDVVIEKARQKRITDLYGLKIGIVSCGELFNKEFCYHALKNKPDIIIGCVHQSTGLSGTGSFPNAVYRERLNQFSKRAGFYTYHSDRRTGPWENRFSGAPLKRTVQHPEGVELRYTLDTDQRYKFSTERDVRKF